MSEKNASPSPAKVWPGGITAITLFVEDLGAARAFYQSVFGLPIAFEDPVSAVFNFKDTMINLLAISEAPGLVNPAPVGSPAGGARAVFTLDVENVDAKCDQLAALGVKLINGPMDRPWGIRTASFADPAGNIWEIAHSL